jgi:4-amino-4-deoxy-L-arabinose transferase-like glycosyltransferase
MARAGETSAPAPPWRAADVAWTLLLLGAVLLPVDGTARWMHATYTATPDQVRAGILVLKLGTGVLALVALAISRLGLPVAPTAGLPAPAPRDAAAWRMVGALLIVALVLRIYRLDTELWIDEIQLRVRYAPLEFRQILSTYDSQNHQPLYTIFAHFALLATGGADWAVRVPAVLFGVASIWALWWWARRVTTTSEAVLGVFLLAVSYHHVWFSQNARGYTAMMFMIIVATGLFRNLLEGHPNPRRLAWGYALCVALATYTHLTVALIAVGHALTVLLVTRWRSPDSRARALWCGIALALSAVVTVSLYAPILPQVWAKVTAPTMEGVSVEWTGAGWMVTEALRVLGEGVPGGVLTVMVALSALAVGVASYWRQSRTTTLLMFLPVLVTMVALVATKHNLWPRFFFFASGFIVLAALRGGFVLVRAVLRWRPDRVALAGATAIGLLSLTTVPRAWQPKQQFRAARDFVEQERLPGDQVVALDIASHVYLLRGWAPTWGFTTRLTTLRESERSAKRTWVVYTLPTRLRAVAPETFEYISPPRYRLVRTFPATIGGGEIQVLLHDSPTEND